MAGCGSIKRAADMQTGPIQDVRVKHGRGDILVAEQLLHGSNAAVVGDMHKIVPKPKEGDKRADSKHWPAQFVGLKPL
jgi:hypothetical protein